MARFNPSEYSKPPKGRDFGYPVPVEGKMAQNYLWQMEQDAKTLHDKLQPHDTLPGWVNYYIATSADRLQQASRYMQHEMAMQGYGEALGGFGIGEMETREGIGLLLALPVLSASAAYFYYGYKKGQPREEALKKSVIAFGVGGIAGLVAGRAYDKTQE
jgi:hypothetical protein